MPSIQDAITKAKTARSTGEDQRSAPQVREESRNRQAYQAGMATQQVQRIESAPRRVEQAAQAEQTNLMRDFERLQAGTPDEVRDWKGIAEATLYVSQQEDQEAQDLKNALLWTYGDQLRPHIEAAGGEDWWEENYSEMPEQDLPWYQDVLKKASPVLDYLDQWGQDGLGVAAGLKSATDTNDGVSAGDGIAHAIRSTARALDVTRAIPGTDGLSGMLQGDASTFITSDGRELSRDLDGDGTLNLREALGKDPEAGGRGLGAIDLIGTIVLDPTTYVTFGGSAAAKTGMRAMEEAAMTLGGRGARDIMADINQRIVRDGWKKLDEAEHELLEAMSRATSELAFERTGRVQTSRLGRDLAQARLAAIRRGGRSGLAFGGITLVPSTKLGNLSRSLGVTSDRLFQRAPREAVQGLTGDAAKVADEISQPGVSLVPTEVLEESGFIRAGDEALEGDNWSFYNGEGDMINVAAPDGRILRVSEEQLTDLMNLLSDMELAWVARNNPVVGELLPPARQTIVRKLIQNEAWATYSAEKSKYLKGATRNSYGAERVARTGDDIEVTGIAGELPAGTPRLGADEAAAELRNAPRRKNLPAPNAPGGRLNPHVMGETPEGILPVPRGPQGVARRMDEVSDPDWAFREGTSTDLVPMPKGELVPVGLRTEADKLLDEAAPYLDDAAEAATSMPPELAAKFDALGYDIVGYSIEGGWFAKLMEIPKVRRVMSAMTPRALLRSRFGVAVADAVGELISNTRASAQSRVSDLLLQVGGDIHKGKLLQSAIEEAGDKTRLFSMLDEALSNPARFDELLAEVGPQQARLLRSLKDAREQIFEATLRGQGYSLDDIAKMMDGSMPIPDNMHDLDTYIPRVLTGLVRNDGELLDRVRKLADDGSGTIGSRSTDSLVEGFMNRRSITDSDSIEAANNEMATALREAGIDAPDQLFETNIPAAFAVRSKSAFEAAAEVDLLDGLVDLTGPGGSPLAVRITPEDLANNKLGELLPNGLSKADFERVELASGVAYYVQNDVASELQNIRRIFGDPKEMSAARDFYDKANNVWAMSATVGLVNPGFHVRNMIGNWFNMFLGGVRDPLVLGRAARLQNTNRQIRNRMAEEGVGFTEAARLLDVDADDLMLLEGARRTGALGDSRTLDLTRAEGGRQAVAPTEQSLGDRLKPWSPDSVFNRKGIQLGEGVEGNARLATYIDQINKGASPEAAAAHVKKYLFDYGDLTRFENETLRRFSRFYTFTRKNTALQFYALTRYPGRVANAQEIVEGAVQGFLDPLGEGEEGLAEAAPDWMPNAIAGRVPFSGQSAALSVDTTFDSFTELTSILTDLAKPRDPLNPEREGFFSKLDGLFSGIGVSAADFMYESSSGRDSFTGRPLNDEHARDHWMFRIAEAALPAVSRGERFAAQLGATRDGEAERDAALMALNWIGGLQVAELDEDATGSQRSALIRELATISDELREEYGQYDPETNPDGMMTLSQMREWSELNEKDRIMEALMYSWETDANGEIVWSEAAQSERIQSLVPAEVLQAFGIDPGEDFRYNGARDRAETDDEEVLAQRNERDLMTAMEAFEMWRGEPLSDEDKLLFLVASPWAPSNELLEGLGYEPYRPGNRFTDEEEEGPSYRERLEGAETALNRLIATAGLDPALAARMRPRMSDMERVFAEADAAGLSQQELMQYISYGADEGGGGVTSRNDRAFINQLLGYEDRMNGLFSITDSRMPDVTPEDQRKIAEKAWQAEEELMLIMQLAGLPRPSQDQIETYVANSIMTSGTLEDLGYDDLKGAKNREDARTDDQQYQDSLSVGEAMARRNATSQFFD